MSVPTIYEALGLAPGAASARLLAACARVVATGKRQVDVHCRRTEPVLPFPVPARPLPAVPDTPEALLPLMTEYDRRAWDPFTDYPTALHRSSVCIQEAEERLLPDSLLALTEACEAWASACEALTDEYCAAVALARDEALRAAEPVVAILLALPAPQPRRRRKMEVSPE